ncbi:MAG: hypothetical protein U0575_08050 [Phycisphaerales bacterium]
MSCRCGQWVERMEVYWNPYQFLDVREPRHDRLRKPVRQHPTVGIWIDERAPFDARDASLAIGGVLGGRRHMRS